MSKSYDNTISIFAEGKALKKSVMGIVTKPIDLGSPLPTEDDNVLGLYKLFASSEEIEQMEADYRAGSIGYGEAKKRLLKKIDTHFAAARERRRELSKDSSFVEDVLEEGAKRAQEVARQTIQECREACGLSRPI
jgi:tryptophanyl-tRNA synthetase